MLVLQPEGHVDVTISGHVDVTISELLSGNTA